MDGFDDDDKEDYFEGVYKGDYTPENLPKSVYGSTAEHLKKGVYKGFKGSLKEIAKEFGYGSAPADLLNDLRENIYLFAGAKTFQQTEEMRGLLVENGRVLPYDDFKVKAEALFGKYNDTWLQTEYITSVGQGESARMWSDIEADKEIFPFVRYVAVIDEHTSDICLPLNGITLPVGHPLWSKITPLNHYRCRCVLEKLEKSEAVVTGKKKAERAANRVLEKMNEGFKMNPGKTGEVFSKEHPFFDVPKEYKSLAKQNFNLPIPSVKKDGL